MAKNEYNMSGMTLRQLSRQLRGLLEPKYGEREAVAMVRVIFERLKGWDAVQMAYRADDEMTKFLSDEAHTVVKRLLNDEPIQYIFGVARFYGMDFKVDSSTLIPRPETAMLVDMIVDEYRDKPDLQVLDLGTGSGCIAIALARNLRYAHVVGVDSSEAALEVAYENARRLHANVKFIKANMLQDYIEGEYDIMVSNPPYIAQSEAADMEAHVLMHEPIEALFVPDSDPLIFYRAILEYARYDLRRGARLYLEINPRFAKKLETLLTAYGMHDVEITKDIEGRDRFITARR